MKATVGPGRRRGGVAGAYTPDSGASGRRCAHCLPNRGPGMQAVVSLAIAALSMALVAAGAPTDPAPATAQSAATQADPRAFPQTGYRVDDERFWEFFRRRGGVRTFGYPVSGTFTLLGQRVQIFQRQVLQLQPDGSVATLNLLDEGLLPYTAISGSSFPTPDPSLVQAAPRVSEPEYHARALQFVKETAPDVWQGMPVNFHATFSGTVRPEDAFPDGTGDQGLLGGFNLELWGLPTSRPARDPGNAAFVYQRFQRGVMHYDAACGCTQGLLLADWFKRLLLGSELPPDLLAQAAGSRLYAQYAPAAPGGVARPAELPGTVLAGAFAAEGGGPPLSDAPFPTQTPTPPAWTGSPSSAGPTSRADPYPTSRAGPYPTAEATPYPTYDASASPTYGTAAYPTYDTSAYPSPTTPPPDRCRGDEEMRFVPERPHAGAQLVVAATSARHHDQLAVRLAGPIHTGSPTERQAGKRWVWEWTVSPAAEGPYEFTFYVGTKACATETVQVLPPYGAAATPSPTGTAAPTPDRTRTATATPTRQPTRTATPTPAAPTPRIAGYDPPSGPATGARCWQRLTILGANFGAMPARYDGRLSFGGKSPTIVTWRETAITLLVPAGLDADVHTVVVSTEGGATRDRYTLRRGGCP